MLSTGLAICLRHRQKIETVEGVIGREVNVKPPYALAIISFDRVVHLRDVVDPCGTDGNRIVRISGAALPQCEWPMCLHAH